MRRPRWKLEELRNRGQHVSRVLSESALKFSAEGSFALSASIAYHSLLSIFPLLLLLLAVSGLFIRHYEASG